MIELDGQMIESVSGGSHWGGGIEIHAEDQARIGLLMLRDGAWNGARILPEGWVAESLTPCSLNVNYGLLWWLNTAQSRYPSAPASSFAAVGAGGNLTWADPEHDIIAVLRWTDPASTDAFLKLLMGAIR
jgi:CubicO group peptidase (beta-lactamase class C family)